MLTRTWWCSMEIITHMAAMGNSKSMPQRITQTASRSLTKTIITSRGARILRRRKPTTSTTSTIIRLAPMLLTRVVPTLRCSRKIKEKWVIKWWSMRATFRWAVTKRTPVRTIKRTEIVTKTTVNFNTSNSSSSSSTAITLTISPLRASRSIVICSRIQQ